MAIVQALNDCEQSAELKVVKRSRRNKRSGDRDHVSVREVDAQIFVLSGFKAFDELVGDLGALHPRALLEGYDI